MTPVTIPPETVAVPVALLLHIPPDVASVKVIELPVHTCGFAGNIMPGAVFTVATVDAEHPAIVYNIVAVPTEFPVITPPAVIEAMPEALLLHAPLPVASVKVAVPPRQTVTGLGLIAEGVALTVTVVVEEQVPME